MSEYGLSDAGKGQLGSLRGIFGANSVVVTSGGRTAARNSRIAGASRNSQHIDGDAIDFKVRDGRGGFLPNSVVLDRIKSGNLGFGQLISETGAGMGPRVHISTGNKGQILNASDENVKKYGRRYVEIARQQGGKYREAIKGVLGDRIGDSVADVLKNGSDALANTGEKISSAASFFDPYIKRGVIGVLGLILIIAAIIVLTRGYKP